MSKYSDLAANLEDICSYEGDFQSQAAAALRELEAFNDEHQSLNALNQIVIEKLEAEVERLRELEALLFDGYAVYLHLPDEPAVAQRTSYNNVSDTLDGMYRAWRAALEPKP